MPYLPYPPGEEISQFQWLTSLGRVGHRKCPTPSRLIRHARARARPSCACARMRVAADPRQGRDMVIAQISAQILALAASRVTAATPGAAGGYKPRSTTPKPRIGVNRMEDPPTDDQNEVLRAILRRFAADETREPDDRALARTLAGYRPPKPGRKPSRGQGA